MFFSDLYIGCYFGCYSQTGSQVTPSCVPSIPSFLKASWVCAGSSSRLLPLIYLARLDKCKHARVSPSSGRPMCFIFFFASYTGSMLLHNLLSLVPVYFHTSARKPVTHQPASEQVLWWMMVLKSVRINNLVFMCLGCKIVVGCWGGRGWGVGVGTAFTRECKVCFCSVRL